MKAASVSVVVPTFNDAHHIQDALSSIVGQTRQPDEIIVADDRSSDDTHEVVLAFARRNPTLPIRYELLETHGGNVAARNHGIRRASGEWVANCDSDDMWLPEKLEHQMSFISAWRGRPLSVLGTYGYNVNDRGRIVSPVTMGPTTEAQYEKMKRNGRVFFLLHSSIIFPKDAYEAVGGYTSEYGAADDCDFEARMSEVGVVMSIPELLVYYRKRSGSMQLAQFAEKREQLTRLAENRVRATNGLAPLDVAAFRRQLDAAPRLERLRRRRRFLGAYHYRIGAACAVNGERLRGGLHLLMVTWLDPGRLTAGLKRLRPQRLRAGRG